MSAPSKGICMRCGRPTTRIVLVGCVCKRCAVEVDCDAAAKRINRALQWLRERINAN